ncbi:MAG: hypothetical protein M3R04_10380, partial [bacterium]|nr:hypothetical protein [bacterium]
MIKTAGLLIVLLMAGVVIHAEQAIRLRAGGGVMSLPILTVDDILGARATGGTSSRLQGGFRQPSGSSGGDDFQRPFPVAWDDATQTIYVGSYGQKVSTWTIPALVNSSTVTDLNRASYSQAAVDPIEGQAGECIENGGATGCGLW